MKKILSTCIIALSLVDAIRLKAGDHSDDHARKEFGKFMSQRQRSYGNRKEYEDRFRAFKETLEAVEQSNAHRANENSVFYRINDFADWLPEELSHLFGTIPD